MHWHIKAIKNEDTYIQLHIKMHTQCSNNNYKQQWASHPSHPYVPLWKNTNLLLMFRRPTGISTNEYLQL